MGPYMANATSPDEIATSSPAPANPEPILPTTAPLSPTPAGMSTQPQLPPLGTAAALIVALGKLAVRVHYCMLVVGCMLWLL